MKLNRAFYLSLVGIGLLCQTLFVQVVAANTALPHDRVQIATDAMLKEIPAAKTYFDKDPERFYAVVDETLSPVIDFNSFTRSVMGPFGKRAYYASLKPEQREQFKLDYRRFVKTFKAGLIRTYAKGLLVFDGQKIVIAPPTEEEQALIAEGKPINVLQTINATTDIFTLRYRMAPNKKGEWVLRNVVMESINVGQLYQNQFVSAMKKYDNNFSQVIDNWAAETKDTDFKAGEISKEKTEK